MFHKAITTQISGRSTISGDHVSISPATPTQPQGSNVGSTINPSTGDSIGPPAAVGNSSAAAPGNTSTSAPSTGTSNTVSGTSGNSVQTDVGACHSGQLYDNQSGQLICVNSFAEVDALYPLLMAFVVWMIGLYFFNESRKFREWISDYEDKNAVTKTTDDTDKTSTASHTPRSFFRSEGGASIVFATHLIFSMIGMFLFFGVGVEFRDVPIFEADKFIRASAHILSPLFLAASSLMLVCATFNFVMSMAAARAIAKHPNASDAELSAPGRGFGGAALSAIGSIVALAARLFPWH